MSDTSQENAMENIGRIFGSIPFKIQVEGDYLLLSFSHPLSERQLTTFPGIGIFATMNGENVQLSMTGKSPQQLLEYIANINRREIGSQK